MFSKFTNSIFKLRPIDIKRNLRRAESQAISASKNRKLVFVAATPKSGSTFLSKKIAEYLEAKWGHVSDLRGGCEFDIYRPSLIAKSTDDYVVQQHTLGTEGNVEYLRRYGAQVVVTTRRLDDTLLSFRRHLLEESIKWPFVKVSPQFRNWPVEQQLDFLVDFVAPWIVNFYETWKSVAERGTLGESLIFSDFESLKRSESEKLASVIRWITKEEPDMARVRQVISGTQKNYRKSSDRSLAPPVFNNTQRQKLFKILSYSIEGRSSPLWPHSD